MATGIPSAHPPYKTMIDGNLSEYITAEYRPVMVQDEQFVFRKPGEIKVAHLDAWLRLLQDRQDRFLRRELDDIFRFAFVKAGPVPKPGVYNPQFMKSYALEHGPIYSGSGMFSSASLAGTLSGDLQTGVTAISNKAGITVSDHITSSSSRDVSGESESTRTPGLRGQQACQTGDFETTVDQTRTEDSRQSETPLDDDDAQLVDQYLGNNVDDHDGETTHQVESMVRLDIPSKVFVC